MKQQKPIIIVWSDWDNTMMASASRFRVVLENTADELGKEGVKLLAPIPVISPKTHDGIVLELFGKDDFTHARAVFQRHYDQIFAPEFLHHLQLFPGVREMLDKIPDAQIYMGIISNHYVEKPEKNDGIKDQLIQNKIDTSRVLIIGIDVLDKHGFPHKQHAKPNTTSGELALKIWNIDPAAQVITSLMFGDAKSDMDFAKNMDAFLKKANEKSSCTGVLFNTTLTGDPIFSHDEVARILNTEESKEAHADRVATGYGKLFKTVKNILSPHKISDEMLKDGRVRLKKQGVNV